MPAMLLTVPDDVDQNTAGSTRLQLVHPETLAPVSSNLADALAGAPPSTMMPDWAPAGDFVVFVAYDSAAHFVRELGDDVVSASIMEMPITYEHGLASRSPSAPQSARRADPGPGSGHRRKRFLAQRLARRKPRSPSPARRGGGRSRRRSLPSTSRVRSCWCAGATIRCSRSEKGTNGAGTILHSTWPQWAPTLGSKYAWIAYSSQKPYGHRLTPSSPENATCTLIQGQTQCKQLWVTAVDRDALANGTVDPSQTHSGSRVRTWQRNT